MTGSEPTSVGVTADDALSWLGSERTGRLWWLSGDDPATEVTFRFSEARAYFVRSKPDPKFTLNIVTHCDDHVEVEAVLDFATADGKLSFTKQRVRLAADPSMKSLAGTIGGIDAEKLRGSYQPAGANQCFEATQLDVSFSETTFSGTLTDTIASDACSTPKDTTGVSPLEGARWSSPLQVPDGWVEVETKCSFSFYAPPELRDVDAHGVDSCVAMFALPECKFSADYGYYSDSLTGHEEEPEFGEVEIIADNGRQAWLVHFRLEESHDARPYFAGVHVPGTTRAVAALTFTAACTTASAQKEALQVLLLLPSCLEWPAPVPLAGVTRHARPARL